MTLNRIKSRVLIIGANFAGLSAASKLSKCHDVTVIDSQQNFQWTPNIHEILSDVKKETSLSVNLETVISKLGYHFINQTVTSIDGTLQTVTLSDMQILNYDVLLIASGQTRANYGIKGANKYAHGFRNAKDVIKISNTIEGDLYNSKTPININIVGGGFTGVEVLGELLRKYAANKQIHFTLIDSASRLVTALPEKLSTDILNQCQNYQVSFYFNQKITEVKKSSIHFSDNTSIKSDITIWTAGTKRPDYIDSLNTQVTAGGIAVNTFLQTKDFDNIFVAGDIAALPKPLAKQASIAIEMGMQAAINISRFCSKQSLKPFRVRSKPVLLSFGDINTYYIQGNLVLASPVLATAKEAVYQYYMARISALLPFDENILGITSRITSSTDKLLLPEILKLRPRVLLSRSKLI